MKNIILIIGTRPNFIKAFSIYNILKNDYNVSIIHTGQHYDSNMSDIFFEELDFKKPDVTLKLNSKTMAGSIEELLYKNSDIFKINWKSIIKCILDYNFDNCGQLGEIMQKINFEIEKIKPSLGIVFGDVTSTLAGSLCLYKQGIDIAHVESGLRNFDPFMPEEVNRYLVDKISKYKFCTEKSAIINLQNEGITHNVFLVGNTMYDTLNYFKNKAYDRHIYINYNCNKMNYVLITIHRQENVDDKEKLEVILNDINYLAKKTNIIFPMHPRTVNNIKKFNMFDKLNHTNIKKCDPLGYLYFICLLMNSNYVITDSGGIQEEAMFLNIRCYTIRKNTERPSTLVKNGGNNILVNSIKDIEQYNTHEHNNQIIYENASKNIKNILQNTN